MKRYKGISFVLLMQWNIYEHWESGQSELRQREVTEGRIAKLHQMGLSLCLVFTECVQHASSQIFLFIALNKKKKKKKALL